MACFRAWEDWAIYSSEYLINLQNLFLGLVATKDQDQSSVSVSCVMSYGVSCIVSKCHVISTYIMLSSTRESLLYALLL